MSDAAADTDPETLVEVRNLRKYFDAGGGLFSDVRLQADFPPVVVESEQVRAVDGVSFDIYRGETLGLVGESGCGKSTLARTIAHLIEPTAGTVSFMGTDLTEADAEELRSTRRDIQMIFQDPQSSLDPRMKVGRIVEEPMRAHDLYPPAEREQRARELLGTVGLDPQHYNRYPHQFSGGQRQRINLARALSVNPDFVVCDEPTSALDASIQAQVLNTMAGLQEEFGLTYLFISHDLSVIRHISDRVAVMYLGEIVELTDKRELFENPQHPYTRALLESIPVPDPREAGRRTVLRGDVPNPVDPPSGCRFRTRCPDLIAPGKFDVSDRAWEAIRSFVRETNRRTFEATSEAQIRDRFFADVTLEGDAAVTVDEAIELLVEGESEAAAALLTETFEEQSICARERPTYEVEAEYGSDHFVACHLHRE